MRRWSGWADKEYRAAVEAAFRSTHVTLRFPFSGLPIGKAMGATKRGHRAVIPLARQR